MSSSSSHSIGAVVERQMRNWEIAHRQVLPADAPEVPRVQPFVTVSRMVGSGGATVARKLAERIGWPLFDREVLQFMAGDDAVRKRLYETMDERDVGFVEESLRAFAISEIKRNDYFHRLTETALTIARKGHAVFLGRGVDLILPRDAGLRVRIVSVPAACASNYAAQHGLDAVRAAREIERIEQERAAFLRSHFSASLDSPDRFDLTFNMASVTCEETVEQIATLLQNRGVLSQ